MIFKILGPLQVTGASGAKQIPPGRQQVILEVLLLSVNRIVTTEDLVDAIWDEDPPDTARTQVQICVSRLRKALAENAGGAAIVTRAPGYVLTVEPDRVDLAVYRSRAAQAEAAERDRRFERASDLYRGAASLWRGPALYGSPSPMVSARAVRLDEDRMNTVKTYLDLDLALGRHHQLVGELSALVSEHPLREGLRAQLMLALFRSGRQAEALETYRVGRALCVRELGLEPGSELRALESAILAGQESVLRDSGAARLASRGKSARTGQPPRSETRAAESGPADPPVEQVGPGWIKPRQLPALTVDLVGRKHEFEAAEKALTAARESRRTGVVVITGKPGVGKSTLASYICHTLTGTSFPDGQLYCDLRGTSDQPLEAFEVLGRFLRALGIPGPAIPETTDERADMYRSILAERRVVVVLDNAVRGSVLGPLLPGGGGSAVVVTSRGRLTSVPGARTIELDILSTEDSLEVMERALGEQRVRDEPAAADALVLAVGRLPLALSIVAARLAARPHWSLAAMADKLADERHRLDELEHGEMTVRASLAFTFDGLEPRERGLLSLLSLTKGPTFPAWLGGALLDDHTERPADLLDPLVDAQMVDVVGTHGHDAPRYRMHDITLLYARDHSASEVGPRAREAASVRGLGGWLSMVDEANRRILGGDYLLLHSAAPRWEVPRSYRDKVLHDPLVWLENEQENLAAAVSTAVESGRDEQCWDLVCSLVPLLETRGCLDDWDALNQRAREFLQTTDNLRGRAALDFSRALMLINRRRYAQARPLLDAALAVFQQVGDELGQAKSWRELAFLESVGGNRGRARALADRALSGFARLGDVVGRGRSLLLTGHLEIQEGEKDAGYLHLELALECFRSVSNQRSQAQVLRRLGQAREARHEHREAERLLSRAWELVREVGDPIGEAYVLHDLGRVHTRAGSLTAARRALRRALALKVQLRDEVGAADVSADLAAVGSGAADHGEAVELERHPRGGYRDLGAPDRAGPEAVVRRLTG